MEAATALFTRNPTSPALSLLRTAREVRLWAEAAALLRPLRMQVPNPTQPQT